MMPRILAQASEATESTVRNLSQIALDDFLRALILVIVAAPATYFLARYLSKLVARKHSAQASFLTRKITLYTGAVLIVVSVMATLNINLTAILGAAGIGAVAIGIAAQSSLSNLISGLFLIVDKSFSVGDTICVDGTVGTVVSIDLLSVKLNTPDNLFVRIPNENLVKTECTTISHNPIRRVDLKIGIAYRENINRVLTVLGEVIAACPLALKMPAPVITATDFGDSSINFMIGAWGRSEDFASLRNALLNNIKERLDKEGIEIPFRQVTLTGKILADNTSATASPRDPNA